MAAATLKSYSAKGLTPKPVLTSATSKSYSAERLKPKPALISMPSVMPLRSNKGGAVRGKARAAQVKALNAAKGTAPGGKLTDATRKAIFVRQYGGVYSQRTGQLLGQSLAPKAGAAKGRSAGINPFGMPASSMLDAIIDSQRKRR